ncbi:MAG: hypothetical protein KJ714_05180 [Euryarchaeota archaeon]|nr:hypothetical protein [Euryarchaeota archaeon]
MRKEVIRKAEAMEDNYILQALLGNFRKTGDKTKDRAHLLELLNQINNYAIKNGHG